MKINLFLILVVELIPWVFLSPGFADPIHIAVRDGNIEALYTLMKDGADVNASDETWNEYKPLHLAAMKGDAKMVEALLDYGALVDATNRSGYTPLYEASYFAPFDSGDPFFEDSYEDMRSRFIQTVRILIAGGANVKFTDRHGVTPLHRAAMNDSVTIAQALIAAGADVNATDEMGETPLQVALMFRNVDMQMALQPTAVARLLTQTADSLTLEGRFSESIRRHAQAALSHSTAGNREAAVLNQVLADGLDLADPAQASRSRDYLQTI